MQGIEIATVDKILVVVYFLLVFGFGSYFGRYIKSTSDFFFSGRKFSWWIIAVSMIATIVGSYSFIKYSAVGFSHGMSSSMAYLNDWFFMPLWMFGWLPIIYFTRMKSVPEYFERRFDTRTRVMAILFIGIYLVGYIGINFFTLGKALHALLGWDVLPAAAVVAVLTAIYVTSGGQTAVIMTDLLQGVLLLAAGLGIFVLGFLYFGDGDLFAGIGNFWRGMPPEKRFALAPFNEPTRFNFVGVFWQDAVASTFATYFFNQGILMRFLSLKSVAEGRKAILVSLVFLFPIAVIAVGNAGWLGAAMHNTGMIPAGYPQDPDPGGIFVLVTHILCKPGVFGLVMAALLAALMSTADTLINATSAVVVNDIWRPYVAPGREDRHYLLVARYASVAAAAAGVILVPLFMQFDSIYAAHGAFVATVGPPMAMCTMMGFLWRGFTASAAFWTLAGGAGAMVVSIWFPALITPLAHGVDPEGQYKYMRAFFGLVASGTIGVAVSFMTKPSKSDADLVGLTVHTISEAARRFKGGEPNYRRGEKLSAELRVVAYEGDLTDIIASGDEQPKLQVAFHPEDRDRLGVDPGDMVFISDNRWWLGGLKAAHARVGSLDGVRGVVSLPAPFAEANSLDGNRGVVVEKTM